MMRVYTLHSDICGTIGCRLTDPSGSIHSAGKELCVVKGDNGIYPHTIRNRGYQENMTFMEDGPEEIFANASEMLMIKRELFKEIGGFNEYYGEVFQDIELNVECLKRSLYNFYLDYAICVFYETNEDRHGDGDLDIRVNYDYSRIVSYLAENNQHVGKYIEIFEKTDIPELMT
jgi:GT2 family glycosyltransferase